MAHSPMAQGYIPRILHGSSAGMVTVPDSFPNPLTNCREISAEEIDAMSVSQLLANNVLHQGFVYKRANSKKTDEVTESVDNMLPIMLQILNRWQEHYVIIYSHYVVYYRDDTGKKPVGWFSLRDYNRVVRAEEMVSSDRKWTFKIIGARSSARTWYFCAPSEREMKLWMACFKVTMDHAIHGKVKQTCLDIISKEQQGIYCDHSTTSSSSTGSSSASWIFQDDRIYDDLEAPMLYMENADDLYDDINFEEESGGGSSGSGGRFHPQLPGVFSSEEEGLTVPQHGIHKYMNKRRDERRRSTAEALRQKISNRLTINYISHMGPREGLQNLVDLPVKTEDKSRSKSLYQSGSGGAQIGRQRPMTTIPRGPLDTDSAGRGSQGSTSSSDSKNISWDSQGSIASRSSDGSPQKMEEKILGYLGPTSPSAKSKLIENLERQGFTIPRTSNPETSLKMQDPDGDSFRHKVLPKGGGRETPPAPPSSSKERVLEDEPWYHGALFRQEAEALLKNEGDFIVRLKGDMSGQYVLSCRCTEKQRHFPIVQQDDNTYRLEGGNFRSVQELIYHHMNTVTPVTRSSNAIIKSPIQKVRDEQDLRHEDIILGRKLGADNHDMQEVHDDDAAPEPFQEKEFTDSEGANLQQFIIDTLRKPQDRTMLLNLEKELVDLVNSCAPEKKFGPMSSYHRMIVHRVAAYFGLDHNVDQSGKIVIVEKTLNTRIPEKRFREHIQDDLMLEGPAWTILKRDTASCEEKYYYELSDISRDDKKSKSFEERQEQYDKARTKIFKELSDISRDDKKSKSFEERQEQYDKARTKIFKELSDISRDDKKSKSFEERQEQYDKARTKIFKELSDISRDDKKSKSFEERQEQYDKARTKIFKELSDISRDDKKSKSFEERQEQYDKARAKIFKHSSFGRESLTVDSPTSAILHLGSRQSSGSSEDSGYWKQERPWSSVDSSGSDRPDVPITKAGSFGGSSRSGNMLMSVDSGGSSQSTGSPSSGSVASLSSGSKLQVTLTVTDVDEAAESDEDISDRSSISFIEWENREDIAKDGLPKKNGTDGGGTTEKQVTLTVTDVDEAAESDEDISDWSSLLSIEWENREDIAKDGLPKKNGTDGGGTTEKQDQAKVTDVDEATGSDEDIPEEIIEASIRSHDSPSSVSLTERKSKKIAKDGPPKEDGTDGGGTTEKQDQAKVTDVDEAFSVEDIPDEIIEASIRSCDSLSSISSTEGDPKKFAKDGPPKEDGIDGGGTTEKQDQAEVTNVDEAAGSDENIPDEVIEASIRSLDSLSLISSTEGESKKIAKDGPPKEDGTDVGGTTEKQDCSHLECKSHISIEGGTVEIPETGVKLEIPAGALSSPELICLRIIPHRSLQEICESFSDNSSVVLELLPNNLQFKHPVKLRLPHCLHFIEGAHLEAKVFLSHHDKDADPTWEEQPDILSSLERKHCSIWLPSFCWVKVLINDELVEAKKLVLYGVQSRRWESLVEVEVGYYLNLPGEGIEIINMNRETMGIVDVRKKPFLFLRGGAVPLQINYERITPKRCQLSEDHENSKTFAFEDIACTAEGSYSFLFERIKDGECSCYFEARQEPRKIELSVSVKSIAQKNDMEERIATLEKQYLNARREAASLHELKDELESNLASKESSVKQLDEKMKAMQEKLEGSEQRLIQPLRKAEALPTVEAELAERMAALSQAHRQYPTSWASGSHSSLI